MGPEIIRQRPDPLFHRAQVGLLLAFRRFNLMYQITAMP